MNLPDALAPLTHVDYWANWRPVMRDGKVTKPPVNPRTGSYLKTGEPWNWFSYSECVPRIVTLDEARGRTTPGFDPYLNTRGIGFCHTEELLLVTLDFDFKNLAPDDPTREWALRWYNRFDTYAETSPGGKGCHVMGWADQSLRDRIGKARPVRCIDLIAKQGFITVTGNVCRDRPLNRIDDALKELLDAEGIDLPPPVPNAPVNHSMSEQEAYLLATTEDKAFQPRLMMIAQPGRGSYNAAVFALIATLARIGCPRQVAYSIIRKAPITTDSPPGQKGEERAKKLERIFESVWNKASSI